MPTQAYLEAQRIAEVFRARNVTMLAHKEGNLWTLYRGTDREQTVDLRQHILRTPCSWRFCPVVYRQIDAHVFREIRPWRGALDVSRIEAVARDVLLPWFSEGWDPVIEDDQRYRIPHLAFMQVWGLPFSGTDIRYRIQGKLMLAAKQTVPESVWKLSAKNAGGLYQMNDAVLHDAWKDERLYVGLYGLHPLLGIAWTPPFRELVQRRTREKPEWKRYARQLQSALADSGVHKAGWRTLHVLAERRPRFLRMILLHVLLSKENRASSWLLQELRGNIRWGYFYRLVLTPMLQHTDNDPDRPEDHRLFVADRLAMQRIALALKGHLDPYQIRDVLDWAHWLQRHRLGSLSRALRDIDREYPQPRENRRRIRAWAIRHSEVWHRAMGLAPNPHIPDRNTGFQSWDPLIPEPVRLEVGGKVWNFVELRSSEDLSEESDHMHHCVWTYDDKCARGLSRIFSVRDEQGQRISTLELARSHENGRWQIAQNRGEGNASVSSECHNAAKAFHRWVMGTNQRSTC